MIHIRFSGVGFSYPHSGPLLQACDLSLGLTHPHGEGGHVIAVMGASGAGKTTLLRLVAGLESPSAGTIAFTRDGHPSTPTVSYLPQRVVLFEHLSRQENAAYFQHVRALRDRFSPALFERLVVKLRLEDALQADGSVERLSGGEAQRLALLRALSIQPDLLLLDEPCNGLDIRVRNEFLVLLREIIDEYRLLVLYVTHHPDEVRIVADDIVYMSPDAISLHPVHASVSDFLRGPPSMGAAQMMSTEPLNVLPCIVADETVVLRDSHETLTFTVSPVPPPGEYHLAFWPSAVRWSDAVGLRVVEAGHSDQLRFVRVAGADTSLVVPREPRGADRLLLDGPVLLFNSSGRPGCLVVLNHSCHLP
jgi:ABC-type sulfate/molybdate transport systems ATPase subunit